MVSHERPPRKSLTPPLNALPNHQCSPYKGISLPSAYCGLRLTLCLKALRSQSCLGGLTSNWGLASGSPAPRTANPIAPNSVPAKTLL